MGDPSELWRLAFAPAAGRLAQHAAALQAAEFRGGDKKGVEVPIH